MLKKENDPTSSRKASIQQAWNIFCVASIVGIWPRFIEPSLISTTHLKIPIKNLPDDLNGFSFVQISDLHFKKNFSERFLERLFTKIQALNPQMIFFTGDFICCGKLEEAQRLKNFLNRFSAPYGCYAILGNHDYSHYVGVNDEGDYDILEQSSSQIVKGLQRLFVKETVTGKKSSGLSRLAEHKELLTLLNETPFTVLENETLNIPIGSTELNLCGLGEYMTNRFDPQKGFEKYNEQFPGIVLVHNPDGALQLNEFPGDLILSGHVHGGQVNLPGIRERFILMENPQYAQGLFHLNNKLLYVNRGLGGTFPFRWFSIPEITHITLVQAGDDDG